MNRLNIYLVRQIGVAFLFAGAAVSAVVLFTQSFRIMSMVVQNAATAWMFVRLMALSIPTFLPLVLPLGLAVAIVFVYNKLAVDSELVVMRAAGMSPVRQARPAILLALGVTAACFILTLWLTPYANRTMVAAQYDMRDSYAVLLARPGNFNDITDGVTFYARERGHGGTLEGILLHDVRKAENPITIMAERGEVVVADGKPRLVIYNGRRQEVNVASGQITQLAFDQYMLDIEAMRANEGTRLPDAREQTIDELLHPSAEMLSIRTTRERLLAELHQRLASPLLAFSFALIGLAAILSGEFNRRGMTQRILSAAAAVIAVQAAMMVMNGMVAKNIWLAFMLYVIALAPGAIAYALLTAEPRRSGASIAPSSAGAT